MKIGDPTPALPPASIDGPPEQKAPIEPSPNQAAWGALGPSDDAIAERANPPSSFAGNAKTPFFRLITRERTIAAEDRADVLADLKAAEQAHVFLKEGRPEAFFLRLEESAGQSVIIVTDPLKLAPNEETLSFDAFVSRFNEGTLVTEKKVPDEN